MTFVNKLNHKETGHLIADELFTLTSSKIYVLKHHQLINNAQLEVWTGVGKTGTQVTNFTISQDANKSWVYKVTFDASVANGDYYVTYYSQGDRSDADDINDIQNAVTTLQGQVNKAGKLVARYVWSGNKVIQPTAIDLATGIVTVSSSLNAQGFNTGSLYNTFFVMHDWTTKILPKEINPITDYYMYVLSDTTFQFSTTNLATGAITSYPDASNTGVNPAKWHLEYTTVSNGVTIDITGMNLSDIRVKADIIGRDRGSYPYTYIIGTSGEYPTPTSILNSGTIVDGRETMAIWFEQRFRYTQETKTLWAYNEHAQNIIWGNNVNGTWTSATVNDSGGGYNHTRPLTNFSMTGVKVSIPMANGSVVEIYDIKGSY